MNILRKKLNDIYVYIINLFENENILIILNICIVLVTIIVILDIYNIHLRENKIKDKNKKIILFENFNSLEDKLINKVNNDPYDKHIICNNMTNNTCKLTSYCVLLDNKKCVGGDQYGPTYLTNNKNKVDYKYYIHKNKCYGECSKNT